MTSPAPRQTSVGLSLAHSPDADDAFMWWALTGVIPLPAWSPASCSNIRIVMNDIESLNHAAQQQTFDITAISAACYPHICDAYAITSCGASFGEHYGPRLVAREAMTLDALVESDCDIAVPGTHTTAALVTALMLGCSPDRLVAIDFQEIIPAIARGDVQAGVVIHEGQLTFGKADLHLIADVGKWWGSQTGLPLPLGLNVIRRSLPERDQIAGLLRWSIEQAHINREDALRYALGFARDVTFAEADEFVKMYVNPLTLDCGSRGRDAITELLRRGSAAGLIPACGAIDIIHAGE
ncbi:MAG: MqnA/MqnD/SBP family protein [Phycisphaerales bacterium]